MKITTTMATAPRCSSRDSAGNSKATTNLQSNPMPSKSPAVDLRGEGGRLDRHQGVSAKAWMQASGPRLRSLSWDCRSVLD